MFPGRALLHYLPIRSPHNFAVHGKLSRDIKLSFQKNEWSLDSVNIPGIYYLVFSQLNGPQIAETLWDTKPGSQKTECFLYSRKFHVRYVTWFSVD